MKKSRLTGWLLGGVLCVSLVVVLLLVQCFSPTASATGTEGLITIVLSDSYGDGWSDNAIEVYSDGELIGTVTMDDGASATWTTVYNHHAVYEFRWVNGVYSQETSFVIFVGTEQMISASGYDFGGGATILSVEKTCSVPNYVNGVCSNCNSACLHPYVGKYGTCADCGYICLNHSWVNGVCSVCSGTCLHEAYSGGCCGVCGQKMILSIEMEDAFSDGWMDNGIAIYADSVLVDTITIDSGFTGSWSTEYVTTATYTFEWLAGSYPEECSFRILLKGEVHFEATNDDCSKLQKGVFYTLEPWCDHYYDENYCCTTCGKACPHTGIEPKGTCGFCGFVCGTSASHVWEDDACQVCGLVCAHESWNDSVCDNCGFVCGYDSKHSFDASHSCTKCGFICGTSVAHAWDTGCCTVCGLSCAHEKWEGLVCNVCGLTCGFDAAHRFDDEHTCSICGFICGISANHAWDRGICAVCGMSCNHQSYSNGVCADCGDYQPAVQNGVGENGYALYEIYNAGQLFWFADYVNSGKVLSSKVILDVETEESFYFEYTSGCVNGKLMADIDISGLTWIPIGRPYISLFNSRNSYGYSGIFDGNGHIVTGIDCTALSDDNTVYAGFFGAICGGTVKNLTVKGNIQGIISTTYCPAVYVGGISGYVCEWFDYTGASTDTRQDVYSSIVNCTFIGSVSADAVDQEFVGGIAGIASGTAISNCLSATTISATATGTSFVGSICGCVINECVITNCWFDSTLSTQGAVNGESHSGVTGMSSEMMSLGGLAHALGFGQTLGVDVYPSYGDDPVYQITTGCCTYSNTKPETVTEKAHSGGSCTGEAICTACGVVYEAPGHNYLDGVCTICGANDPDVPNVIIPTLNLDHPSLSFEGEIMYNLYFTADDLTNVVEMGLIAFSTKNTEGTIDNAENVYPGYIEAGGMYMSQTAGVPARYLGDAVYFKAYAKLSDGSYVYSDMVGYNAVVYAKSILKNSTNDYMKRLVVAMINYGAEAQGYFCTKEGVEYTPMNNFLTADQQALINAYDASMVADLISVDASKVGMFIYNTGDFAKRTNSVSFDGAFAINYYFTAKGTPDNGMKFYYWNTADYLAADVLTPENATGSMDMVAGSGNQYWGQVSGIAAKEVDQTYFVAGVYELDGVTYTTGILAYSLGKYCAKLAAGTTEQQALSAATAVYGYYAKEYFANI